MSGATIAYHLRPNKAIERHLFVELLGRLEHGMPQSFSEYRYYGFGGAYMEDFRLIQRHFGVKRMVSIERNDNAMVRQKFNKPSNCIVFSPVESKQFADSFSYEKPAIVWLDYTEPKWAKQLAETDTLIRALAPNSILKITIAAQPTALGNIPPGVTDTDLQTYRLGRLQELFGKHVPGWAKASDLTTKAFPKVLASIIKSNLAEVYGVFSTKCVAPLALYSYDDGTPMLTVTLLVGIREVVNRSINRSRIRKWKFASKDWDSVISINAPDLTMKERLYIESLLPKCDARSIHKKLGFSVGDNDDESILAIDNYIDFHRQLPFFLKVTS